jgi:hypothetical protein
MPATETQQQHWSDRRFVYFKGQFDTHIETGEDYPTQALAKLFKMAPGNKPKGAGLACIPSTYADFDAREHAAQRERGRFIALAGDVDSGNHSLDAIREGVTAFVNGAAWMIYSSPHARPDDMRWRIIPAAGRRTGLRFMARCPAFLFRAHGSARHCYGSRSRPCRAAGLPAQRPCCSRQDRNPASGGLMVSRSISCASIAGWTSLGLTSLRAWRLTGSPPLPSAARMTSAPVKPCAGKLNSAAHRCPRAMVPA